MRTKNFVIFQSALICMVAFAMLGAGSKADAGPSDPSSMIFPAYHLRVTAQDKKALVLNTHTSLSVIIEPVSKDAVPVSELEFDARMPEHSHGMVTKAKVTKVGVNEFRVEGVRLHMAGKWLFEFKLKHGEGETIIASSYFLNQ